MNIRYATINELKLISYHDKHVSDNELKSLINQKRIIIAEENKPFLGWLRYNLFWDNTPFMNMLFVLEPYRRKNIGKSLVLYWENEMKNRGYKKVMTSTQANEDAQHFYRLLGYRDCGSLILPNEPLEIIFIKEL